MTDRNPYFDEGRFIRFGMALDMVQALRQAFEGKFAKQKAIEIPVYADLTAITDAITDPNSNMVVMVTGQGIARYDGTNWVLAWNDSTLVT